MKNKLKENMIAFRAFDKKSKTMHQVKLIDLESEAIFFLGKKAYLFEEDFYDSLKFDDVELMQYTGIKDKKGRWIYEGDIIRREIRISDEVEIFIEFVKFCDGKFVSEDRDNLITDIHPIKFHSIEVIGNIYQNPELLNEK